MSSGSLSTPAIGWVASGAVQVISAILPLQQYRSFSRPCWLILLEYYGNALVDLEERIEYLGAFLWTPIANDHAAVVPDVAISNVWIIGPMR